MPDRAALEASQKHIFDLARESGSNDPAVITQYFIAPPNLGRHHPLETVRRYYTQVSYWFARGAFNLGADLTHSPTGAVVFFQLASALVMAIALAMLATFVMNSLAIGEKSRSNGLIAAMVFATLASEPVMLSLSRQMLTETAGFLMLVVSLVCFCFAVAPHRRTLVAMIFAAIFAGFCFLTIRTRYTLGPAELVLLPLLLLLSTPLRTLQRRRRHFALVVFTAIVVFVALVAVDLHHYGPFILPWVYDRDLVQTTRIYFHSDQPYEPFWVMLYVNLPLLIVPLSGVACWLLSVNKKGDAARVIDRQHPIPLWQRRVAAIYAASAMLMLSLPIALMARQQVSFQPRHLFAFSAIFICVLIFALPNIRWRRFTAIPFVLLCVLILAGNIYSITGPQRTTMAVPWPKTIAGILRDRTNPGPHPSLIQDLADGYFDWSDNTRVFDYLVVFRCLQRSDQEPDRRPLLIIDSNVPGCGIYGFFATRFKQPSIWWDANARSHETELAAIQSVINGKTAVFLITSRPPRGTIQQLLDLHPTHASLNSSTLFRVERVLPDRKG